VAREFEARDLIEVMEEAVNYNRFLLEALASWASGAHRVLDFGAGNGRLALGLRERGFEVHAVEPDPLLRQGVASKGIVAYEGLEALGQQRFERIYTVNVLEHVEDDRALLEALHDHLDPGGRLFVYVPAYSVLFSANDERVGHLRRYRKSTLLPTLDAAGFAVEEASYVDSIGFAAGLGYRFFGRRDGGVDAAVVRFYDAALFPLSRRLDRVLGRFVGKNLLVRAVRVRSSSFSPRRSR
jgi:SAM-dependent methyltransferase